MSALTKILIVLLTLSSIFLCGIVATYVANADNYKQQHRDLKNERDSLGEKVKGLTKQLGEKVAGKQQIEDKLNTKIGTLGSEIRELQASLNNVEREKSLLLQKVNSWNSITKDFYQTTDKQGQLLKNTLEELNTVQAEQIKQHKELNETTASLIEKMAIIDTLESEKKRLVEEKVELQNKLDQLLQPMGRVAVPVVPVTPEISIAKPAKIATKGIDLQGLVSAIDLKNSMAKISIGSADGVKDGMKFHVTRGSKFICDILIIDVDTEEAVGILELVQETPKVGDNVSTNL